MDERKKDRGRKDGRRKAKTEMCREGQKRGKTERELKGKWKD